MKYEAMTLSSKKNSISTTNDVLNESSLIELNFNDPKLIRCNYVYHWNIDHVIELLEQHLPEVLKHVLKHILRVLETSLLGFIESSKSEG